MAGFETSKFGYAGNGTTAGTPSVSNHYGGREVSKSVGHTSTDGHMNELVIDLDSDMVGDAAFPLLAPILPAKSIVEDVYLDVEEAFVLGGTSPAVEIGTEGSEATNGVTLSEAQLEAVGLYDVTSALAGTWAAGLSADTTVGLAFSGTSPTVTDVGKARIVIRYMKA